MSPVLAPRRSINDLQVIDRPDGEGQGRIVLRWLDGAGEQREQQLFGMTAHLVRTDIAAVSLLGEHARSSYLTGFIRACDRMRSG